MAQKKRKRGKRNPFYETKLAILQFLSEGKKSKPEIREYLKRKYNIREKKGIDNHLRDLQRKGLIIKEPTEMGKPVYIKLDDSYEGFKQNFSYVMEHGNVKELMQSPYAQNVLNENIFKELAKDLIKCFAKHFIEFFVLPEDEIRQEPLKSLIMEEMKKNKQGHEGIEFIQSLNIIKKTKMQLEQYKDKPDYEKKKNEIITTLVDKSIELLPIMFEDIPIVETLEEFLFPIPERSEILQIMRTSPSALNTLISIGMGDLNKSIQTVIAYGRYYFPILEELSVEFLKDIKENKFDSKKFFKRFRESLFEIYERERNPTPILTILRGQFISDIFTGKIVENEYTQEYYQSLFVLRKREGIK